MKEDKDIKPIDDLYRQSLEGYTPPPPAGAWKNIRKSLAKGRRSRWYFLFSIPVISVVSAIILTVSAILIYSHYHTPDKSAAIVSESIHHQENKSGISAGDNTALQNSETKPLISTSVNEIVSGEAKNQPSAQNTTTSSEINKQAGKISKPVAKGLARTKAEVSAKTEKTEIPVPAKPSGSEGPATIIPTQAGKLLTDSTGSTDIVATSANSSDQKTLNSGDSGIQSKSLPDTTRKASPASPDTKPVPEPKQVTKDKIQPVFFIAAGGSAGQVVYRSLTPQPFFSALATVGMNFPKYKAGIETGLGYSQYRDKGLFEFEFRQIDTTGYTSYTYYNPQDSTYLIVFKPIIDTTQLFREIITQTSFTYLNFPIYFSKQLLELGKFRFGITAGPSVNFLISKYEKEPTMSMPDAVLINRSNHSYSRLAISWQLLVATRFSWQFSEHFTLQLQPSVNFYLNNLYKKSGKPSSDPFGINIRAGVQYNFGR